VNEVRQLRAFATLQARQLQDEARALLAASRALRSDIQEVRSINSEDAWRLRHEVRRATEKFARRLRSGGRTARRERTTEGSHESIPLD
jgi:hypothetical protein